MDKSKMTISNLPFGERKSTDQPDIGIYEFLGEDGVRDLVNKHYDLLVESSIKEIFPPKGDLLDGAKKRSADFFIQRLGGPDYYKQTRGNPMLASRHLPFKITPKARVVWLECYREVLSTLNQVPEHLLLKYWKWLDQFSNWMVNEDDAPTYKVNFKL